MEKKDPLFLQQLFYADCTASSLYSCSKCKLLTSYLKETLKATCMFQILQSLCFMMSTWCILGHGKAILLSFYSMWTMKTLVWLKHNLFFLYLAEKAGGWEAIKQCLTERIRWIVLPVEQTAPTILYTPTWKNNPVTTTVLYKQAAS